MIRRRGGREPKTRTAVTVGLVVFLTLIGSGAATAAWTAEGVSTTGTARAAAVGVTMTGSAALGITWTYNSSPPANPTVIPLTLTNTGSAPLNLSLALVEKTGTLGALIDVTLWKSANGTCPTTVPATGTTAGTFDALPPLPTGATSITNGTSFVLCVATRPNASRNTSRGQFVQARLALTGTVGAHWSVTRTDVTFTQTVPA